MKKYIQSIILLTALFFVPAIHAQTNSVELKDGGGNVLSQHNSIVSAYAAIPVSITQSYIIELTAIYNGANEIFPIVFPANSGSGPANTITLRPAAGVVSMAISNTSSGANMITLADADYFIIDGRPGGVGNTGVLTLTNSGTTSSSNTIGFINGACHNVVRYCSVQNGTTGSAGRGIFFGTSASNPTGNSDNRVEFCSFSSGRYQLNSAGTTANRNSRNTVYGCEFTNIIFVGIWGQSGTGKMRIDSCRFSCNTASGDGPFGILFDSQADTIVIEKNRIGDILNGSSASSSIRGISIRSVSGVNLSIIRNNFIALGNGSQIHTNIVGIEYGGANQTNGQIYHNSIRIAGTLSGGGTSGNVGSSCFNTNASNAGNLFDIKNNIFVNERTGGTPGLQHLAIGLSNTAGIIHSDYNTYNSAGDIGRIGTTPYATFPLYQAASSPGEELNSNDEPVNFVSLTDLHLSGPSIGNPNLLTIPVGGITTDIDNTLRSGTPYRGAHEAAIPNPNCSGIPSPGQVVSTANPICPGDPIMLTLSGIDPVTISTLTFQWISSPNGVNYTPVPLATNDTLLAAPNAGVYYSCIVTCTNSGLSDSAQTLQITVNPLPTVANINAVVNADTVSFSPVSPQNETGYFWNFDDGNTSTSASPTHIYTAPGTYSVMLVVSNGCGTDTVVTQILVGCSGIPSAGNVAATNVNLCPGDSALLYLTGLIQNDIFSLNFQWQLSADGISFSDIIGATNDSLLAIPTDTTFYRCIVACINSGLSDTSVVLILNLLPLPVAGTISETHTGLDYAFSSTGGMHASSYSWNFGDGDTSTAQNPMHTYAANGVYTVTLVVSNACGTDTAETTVMITLGTDANEEIVIQVYPNPAQDLFHIVTNDPDLQNVRIADISGKILQTYLAAVFQEGQLLISAVSEGLKPGIYLIEINGLSRKSVQRLIVQ